MSTSMDWVWAGSFRLWEWELEISGPVRPKLGRLLLSLLVVAPCKITFCIFCIKCETQKEDIILLYSGR